jgi:hypothetical protein
MRSGEAVNRSADSAAGGRAPADGASRLGTFAARRLGTHALYVEADGNIRIETVAAARGVRPWSMPPASGAARAAEAARRTAKLDQ